MTGILLMGKLFVSVRDLSDPAPAHLSALNSFLKRSDGLNAYLSEATKLKEINSSRAFQNQPTSGLGKSALDEPAVYEIKVAQDVSDRWAGWFDGLDLARDDEGNTLLTGIIVDQAALHGVLAKIRDLNLILLAVTRK